VRQALALQNVMSALPLKADMCSALAYVCFGPIADIGAARQTDLSGMGVISGGDER
jgi:hypothetical protein